MICGNGGLAAESSHFAAEMVGVFSNDVYISCISLTTDTAIITALSNDLGFENVFSHQIKTIGKPNDVLIAMTSHNSRNIEKALWQGRLSRVFTVALCAESSVHIFADLVIRIAGKDAVEMQENTLKYLHELAAKVKERIADVSACKSE